MAKPKKTFDQWMAEINVLLIRNIGLSSDDLPDCPYRDWYEDGVSSSSAAARAKKRAAE